MADENLTEDTVIELDEELNNGTFVTLSEAKAYLRVDSSYEDGLIASLLSSACMICMDVARLSTTEWKGIADYTANMRKNLTIHTEEFSKAEILQMKEVLRIAILYALGYLYEHREEADHHDLVLTLRNLLFSIREGVF